ncbi:MULTISPECIES: tRNA (guanosine(46)-N7)-methyltransferase TrmB [Bacillus]|uniref:tRNA (guanine-N(7)-)-methyltransferase n=2 Tax=Bacillus TaxID=1386 RepID=A0A0M4G9I7_9BACI|nr:MULTISPECIES: tRNA (guanosine(46)-N7)-methyltransferase TrmB [Bacillus]ALC82053.1 tRNA (guanine-N7)-methyltransferase [Bacillus gobiensis]MBP1083400.1 tRNA (guanine-N7-)-methyltransferase [Bacillus capparidis]MED1097832.1 tRNA (guanosine(46)-N7)-methyltransferase TrmB [Bacillus capparidis]
MRMRNKPWADDFLRENSDVVISDPETLNGQWENVFTANQPLHIEVGTGKGQFITGMAKQNQDINYIGIELAKSVIVTAAKKIQDMGLQNVKMINMNADSLTDIFEEGEVDRIYLNFSDPWPKKRHEKRRLTHSYFLKQYEKILGGKGAIHFKTDNQGLFEYSLKSFSEYGLLLTDVSLDLHNSGIEGNIMTEYEEKFSSKGQRIYRAEVEWRS